MTILQIIGCVMIVVSISILTFIFYKLLKRMDNLEMEYKFVRGYIDAYNSLLVDEIQKINTKKMKEEKVVKQ